MFKRIFFRKFSLRTQLLLILLFLLCMTIVSLTFIYSSSEQALTEKIMENIDNITKVLQVSLEEFSYGGDAKERLKKYVAQWNTKGINEISLIGENSKIIASSDEKKVGKYVSIDRKKDIVITAHTFVGGKKDPQKIYSIVMPVFIKGQKMGYVLIRMTLDDYGYIQRKNHLKRILSMVFAFAIGIVISLFIAQKYTDPIKKVAMISKKIAEGELVKIPDPERKDEIGTLIKSFNEMVEKLGEQKKLEERLKESEKFSAIAQISSGMAHEIRNPLNFLSLSIEHIKERIEEEGLDKKGDITLLLDSLLKEIQRINMLIHNFLLLGKEIVLHKEFVDMERLVSECIKMLKDKLKEGVKIEVNGKEKEAVVYCDMEYMRICLINLILNAIQAIEEEGRIDIGWEKNRNKFCIYVSDTGKGIDEEDLNRIFEPYYTTKKFGIGLGLTITKRFVEAHGGKITVESKKDKGTRVTMEIPYEN